MVGGVLAVGAALFTWGFVRLRRHTAEAEAAIRALDLATVPELAAECARGFARPAFEWAYVLPVGAYLGELIRRHQPATWHADPDTGSPRRAIGDGEAIMHTHPFDKVLEHRYGGDGDLYAYVQVALRGPAAAAGTSGLQPPEA